MSTLDGNLVSLDGRAALRFERRLPFDLDRVWRAVTDPRELAQWFVAPVSWTPALGETLEAHGQVLEVTDLEPPTLLAWTWGDERFVFELSPAGDHTLLAFTHVFTPTYGPADQHAAGWQTYFDRLDALLAGRPISEETAHDNVSLYHEGYAALFGANPEAGRRMIAGQGFRDLELARDGAAVRLERRYRVSPERLWRALTDPGELGQWFPELDQLEVTEADPPRLLEASWWGTRLRFELRPDGEFTVLAFENELGEPGTSARTAAGWDRCFFALEALLAGHPVSREESLELWPPVHERYAEKFGADPEIGRAAFAQATEQD